MRPSGFALGRKMFLRADVDLRALAGGGPDEGSEDRWCRRSSIR